MVDIKDKKLAEDAFLTLLGDTETPTGSTYRDHEKSHIFRMNYKRTKRRKQVIQLTAWTSAIIIFFLLSAGALYFIRKIYYLGQPDNTVGEVGLSFTLPNSQLYQQPVDLEQYMKKTSSLFSVVDVTQFDGLSAQLEHRLGNKKYKPVKVKKITKKADIKIKKKIPVEIKKKTLDDKTLDKIFKDAGYK